ncbi:MAG: lactate dehydrogenase, partial [Methylobacillus sp.]|nr:lactate dehydrogenase [Methylobacillus sp.]
MNHFMARLIFCFFAEDTDIFNGSGLFTATIEQMSARDSTNTHEVISEIFRAMNIAIAERNTAQLRPWANQFPYVNGGLFSGNCEVPRLSKIARSYLLNIGSLDWTQINPDIFGSMIQAVADDEERGALGMHYTSVPNILKVLNPLFLDDLRRQLAEAGGASAVIPREVAESITTVDSATTGAHAPSAQNDRGINKTKLLNLRKRMARIRVFDPACGSGNFLVIAYKEMREIEAHINQRRGEADRASDISLKNFRGIELRDFPAEIARLALIIAEYQCDVRYRGQKLALIEFLPLDKQNWIVCGNALRLDWLNICPPTGTGVKITANDLFETPLEQTEIDFENEGGETYICGNPPYLGSTWQDEKQKSELKAIFDHRTKNWKSLDYVAGWFMKAADYGTKTNAAAAFVSTNSICQGQQVPILWPLIFKTGHEISFAHTSFKWANLASHNAGVTVAIVGISNHAEKLRPIFSLSDEGTLIVKEVENINAYLVSGANVIVKKMTAPPDARGDMDAGGKPVEGGNLFLSVDEKNALLALQPKAADFIKTAYGASEYIRGDVRHCLWISDANSARAKSLPEISNRLSRVVEVRNKSPKPTTKKGAAWPYRFEEIKQKGNEVVTIVPKVSSESREFLPVGLLPPGSIITDLAFALYDAPLWNMALIASRLHLVWIATVCGKLKTDFRYSNTLGWNTFPVPLLTEQNKADLTECAENILLAREVHFPATIADLYDPGKMPENLRHAH